MLYTDIPINSSDEDLLERSTFAKATARSLVNMQESGTFTVGLYGKWGTGKTSLINMILQEIQAIDNVESPDQKTIIIRFEPWNFSNTDQLLSQFFVRLINEFYSKKDKNLQKVSNAFEKYLLSLVGFTKLIPVVGEQINDVANKSFSWFKKKATKGAFETDIMWQKENVISILKKANRRLLIVIDDIDRLSNEQIRCVFQLVTSVAKFPKTTYLLAFDKDIVVKALEDVQKGSGEAYLEKVIQIPIQIPALWKEKVEEILFHRLDSLIAESRGLHFDAQYWQNQYPVCVKPFIRTLRDINRLCNAIRFKIQGIADDLDFTDIVSITILEMEYPAIYEWILSNKILLTGGIDENFLLSSQWKKEEWEAVTIEQWKSLLQLANSSDTAAQQLEKVTSLITHLFPRIGDKLKKFHVHINPLNYNELRAGNHISHPEKFDRYFDFRLRHTAISHSELTLLLTGLVEEGVIDYFRSKKDASELREVLEEIHAHCPELPPDRAKVLIRAILKASEYFSNENADLLRIGNRSTAEYLLRKLFERIPEQDRYPIIEEQTLSADSGIFEMLSDMLNTTELAFGRLAAEGNPRDIIKILSLDELLQWETVYVERARQLLEVKPIFEFENCRMILYLLEQFDTERIEEYMGQVLKEPINIIRYLEHTIAKWTGSGISYEVQSRYQKYISDQQILDAIEHCKNNSSLYKEGQQTQLMCAVFYLYHEKIFVEAGHVSATEAHNLLEKWKVESSTVSENV